ncbi:MAG TPA: sugar phosphate nucleotidyltransferase [Pirellulaceae bacterium]|nr:sugar phosphate nucleotidyltransferase [Pirellulaceae bacterium]
MKVVLFCGGFGMRLREYSEAIPKPLVNVGHRPILWHIMKYYAHFGHHDFILCLGWKSEAIKEYFLNYNECLSNDFVMSKGGSSVVLLNSDIQNWSITFVDTGMRSNIGERLKAVEPHLAGEKTFLANYTDGLSDLHLPTLIDFHLRNEAIATLMTVRPTQTCHCVTAQENGRVTNIRAIAETNTQINAGFFVLDQQIFSYLHEGEELILEPFDRLIEKGKLFTMPHDGFFGCMDTYKEKQMLDDMHAEGSTPWELWRTNGAHHRAHSPVNNHQVTRR